MIYYSRGSEHDDLSIDDLKNALYSTFEQLGSRKKVLAIPPDFTRFHSQAGTLTELSYDYYQERLKDILPATGTHSPMTNHQIGKMFGKVPHELFRTHDWRHDVLTLGKVPSEYIGQVSGNVVDFAWPAQVNKLLVNGDYDLIISLGQVVPHEVAGMANYNKNIFVGTGGYEGINKSHFLGAAYGMERMMGRADTPVRRVLNYASENFARDLPIVYVLTVVEQSGDGQFRIRGLFIGDDAECFNQAAALSLKVNFKMLDKPLEKVVAYLDPAEYKSTWLGNKSIYRTRMAIADGGELLVLAPGVREFGEDPEIDQLIRKYGYVGTPKILELVEDNHDLKENLSAAAHLIHSSSEERFRITYCPGHLSKSEIQSVNFTYADLEQMLEKYDPKKLKNGMNTLPDGEQIYYISNPGLGLWSTKERFEIQ